MNNKKEYVQYFMLNNNKNLFMLQNSHTKANIDWNDLGNK
jgi:hypothetical protein